MMACTHVDFPKEMYLLDVDVDFQSAEAVRAAVFAAQLEAHLADSLDEDWMCTPDTGDLLRAFWRPGYRYTLDELASALGSEGLSARPLIELTIQKIG